MFNRETREAFGVGLNQIIPEITRYFGPTQQKIKTLEEMAELAQVICKELSVNQKDRISSDEADREYLILKIIEEVADCLIMLHQMRYIYDAKRVDTMIEYKLKLIQERMCSHQK